MNKMKNVRRSIALIACTLTLCGCVSKQAETAETTSAETQLSEEAPEEIVIDYGDAESFEEALNRGENLEGKVVRFIADELHPKSKMGYNVWAGEHLNFVSPRNPDIKEKETVTVRTTIIENINGSWFIKYEKVENAVMGENTITSPPEAETTAETELTENTYEHNEYYDIIETASFKDSLGCTVLIHKVLAKKDVSVSSTVLAYGADGSILDKSTDDIILTAGQNNFFCYYFYSDISNADLQENTKFSEDTFLIGERNAVEMVKHNQSDNNLYITFKQNVDKLSPFAKFKLLFYKNDKIVKSDYGFFSINAENLVEKDSTDVAEIWVYGVDYDRIEYIFEP